MKLGQDVIFNNGAYGEAVVREAAKVVAVHQGGSVNLIYWSAAGVQSIRHDVQRSDLGAAGCWSPMPVDAPAQERKGGK